MNLKELLVKNDEELSRSFDNFPFENYIKTFFNECIIYSKNDEITVKKMCIKFRDFMMYSVDDDITKNIRKYDRNLFNKKLENSIINVLETNPDIIEGCFRIGWEGIKIVNDNSMKKCEKLLLIKFYIKNYLIQSNNKTMYNTIYKHFENICMYKWSCSMTSVKSYNKLLKNELNNINGKVNFKINPNPQINNTNIISKEKYNNIKVIMGKYPIINIKKLENYGITKIKDIINVEIIDNIILDYNLYQHDRRIPKFIDDAKLGIAFVNFVNNEIYYQLIRTTNATYEGYINIDNNTKQNIVKYKKELNNIKDINNNFLDYYYIKRICKFINLKTKLQWENNDKLFWTRYISFSSKKLVETHNENWDIMTKKINTVLIILKKLLTNNKKIYLNKTVKHKEFSSIVHIMTDDTIYMIIARQIDNDNKKLLFQLYFGVLIARIHNKKIIKGGIILPNTGKIIVFDLSNWLSQKNGKLLLGILNVCLFSRGKNKEIQKINESLFKINDKDTQLNKFNKFWKKYKLSKVNATITVYD